MGAQAVPLREEDIQRIGDYVKPWIREQIESAMPRPVPAGIDVQLLERMVRVEEELQSQRELMDHRFGAMDQRFEDLMGHTDNRFVELLLHTDTRFKAAESRFGDMNARFGDVQASIRSTQWLIGIGFVLLTAAVTVFGFLA